MTTRMAARVPPRLCREPQAATLGIRELCLASWRAARLSADGCTVSLNAASAAGLYLEACGDATVAAARVRCSDDWGAQVRKYLDRIAEEDSSAAPRAADPDAGNRR
jgi:hypothetical protein